MNIIQFVMGIPEACHSQQSSQIQHITLKVWNGVDNKLDLFQMKLRCHVEELRQEGLAYDGLLSFGAFYWFLP